MEALVGRLECSTGVGDTVQNEAGDLNRDVRRLHEEVTGSQISPAARTGTRRVMTVDATR
jgi:hypothetical protein